MAALVAAAAAQVGDRTAWLAAILADRWRKPGLVIACAALALLGAGAIAAAGGALLAPMIAPERQAAAACARAAAPGRRQPVRDQAARPARRLAHRRRRRPRLLGIFILAFGDGIQFIVAALAARSPVPALAAVGATLGSLAVVAPAALMGEAAWLALPLRPARIGIGLVFAIVGAILALSALGLV